MSYMTTEDIEINNLIRAKMCGCLNCEQLPDLKDSFDFDTIAEYKEYLQALPLCRACDDTGEIVLHPGRDEERTELCWCKVAW